MQPQLYLQILSEAWIYFRDGERRQEGSQPPEHRLSVCEEYCRIF